MVIASGRAASDSFVGRAPGRALLWPGSSSATSSPSGGAVGSSSAPISPFSFALCSIPFMASPAAGFSRGGS